jgi:hypothetical protein
MEETVESRPGIVQVGDGDDPVLGEAETCQRFRESVVRNRERLACDALAVLECPELIRPLAAVSCTTYSEPSLTACIDAFDEANDCEGLLPGACVLTAVSFRRDPACIPDASASHSGGTNSQSVDAGPQIPDGSIETPADVVDGSASDAAADGAVTSGQSRDEPIETAGDADTLTELSALDASAPDATTTPASIDAGSTLAQSTVAPTDGG